MNRRGAITAQAAVSDLYRIAITERKTASTARLDLLADFCVQELTERGLPEATKEASIPGAGRPKRWDVGWRHDGKYRLAISLKSILRNLGGAVPNRIDDLIGEVANAQLHSPEIVIGYVVIFDTAEDHPSARRGSTWRQLLRERLTLLSGRRPPSWTTGTVEDFLLVEVDFGADATIRAMSQPFDAFFGALVEQVGMRNPGAVATRAEPAAHVRT